MRSELENLPPPAWFHHGEHILALLEEHRPMEVVELGTYAGGSAIAIARVIAQWGGRLTTIDAFTHGTTIEQVKANFAQYAVPGDVVVLKVDTREAAKDWRGGKLVDFLYVDGDHSYDGCLADLEAWYPLVRSGGVICGDDYGRPEMNVTEAWEAFAKPSGRAPLAHVKTPGVDGTLVYVVKP